MDFDMNMFQQAADQLLNMVNGHLNSDTPFSNQDGFHIFDGFEPSKELCRDNPAEAAREYAKLSFRVGPGKPGCKGYAKKAIAVCPDSILGWRQMIHSINQLIDGDSNICLFRELLSYAYKYKPTETEDIRLVLSFILDIAFQSEQDDVATFAAEELCRIYPEELSKPQPSGDTNPEYLAVFYVKILGKIRRHVFAQPVRKIEHLKALYDCAYHQHNEIWNFVELVLAFNTSNASFKSKLQEIKSKNPFVIDCMMLRSEGSKLLMSMIFEWPSLVIQAAKILKERQFRADRFNSRVPDIANDHSKPYRKKMLDLSNTWLDKGRESLRGRNFSEAMTFFTLSHRSYNQSIIPNHRWYTNANFAIATNRATTAMYMKEWNILRLDIRFAVLIKPDHDRMYSYVPLLIEGFKVPGLKDEYEKIASDAKQPSPDWNELSKRTIGVLSLEMIILSLKGELTPEVRDLCIQRGIDDFYTCVNRPIGEIEKLPWLSESDIEPKI